MKKASSSALPDGRSLQKAVLATTKEGAARTRSRSRVVQISAMGVAAPAPEALAAATHLSSTSPVASAMTCAASQLLAAHGSYSNSAGGGPPCSASLDPLLILRCDAGHARHVTHLHLAQRRVAALHPNVLLFVNLEELWLNDNELTELRGIAPPPALHHLAVPCGCLRLKRLFLSNNRIASFAGSDLPRLRHIEVLLLTNNRLAGLETVSQQLAALSGLKQLDLSGNPLAEEKNYREYVIAHHPTLEVLDRRSVTQAERDKALALFPPVQVSKSRGTASVSFGSTVPDSSQQRRQRQQQQERNSSSPSGANERLTDHMNMPSLLKSPTASGLSYASSSGSSSAAKLQRGGGGGSKNPFMSQMAEVLEKRAQAVRSKRDAQRARVDAQEEHEFQECASHHVDFHRQWEETAREQIVRTAAQQQKEQLEAATAIAGLKGTANKASQAQQLLLQQQTPEQLAAAQLAAVVPLSALPPLKRGVVPSIFDGRRHLSKSLPELLYMERDADVFAKCLDAAERGDADEDATELRRLQETKKAEAAALEEIETKSLRSAFTAGTQHAIRDLCFRVCDIVGMDSKKHLDALVAAFYADSKARHGRLDGQHVIRALMEYSPFVEDRVQQLYSRSHATVRAKPEEATALLRRISALNDYLKKLQRRFEVTRDGVGSALKK